MVMERIGEIEQRLNSPDEDERLRAVIDLAGVDDPEGIRMLVEILEQEESRAVREAAAVALISTGSEAVAEEVSRLLRSRDPYVRNTASDILQCIGEAAEGVLTGLLSDPDPDVRGLAVRAIGRGELPSAARLLREVVVSDGDINVVASAAEFLGVKGSSEEDAEALRFASRRFRDPYLDFVVDDALAKLRALGGSDV